MSQANRPLSPHLQVYKPMLSMMMSIAHRITGAALFFGIILLVWWLVAAAWSDAAFDMAQGFFGHWFGQLVMLGFTWALIHHLLGGIRHFIWDTGKGFELATVEMLVCANLIGSMVVTALIWFCCYRLMA